MPELDLFAEPFVTGLVFALVLPVLGAFLRLRHEWLAALAYPHVAAAGALLSLVIAVPSTVGGVLLALVAGAGKRLLGRRHSGDAVYALFLLGGWAVTILVTANLPQAERFGHALFDGQLYFSGRGDMLLALAAGALALGLLFRWSPRLLLQQLYPDFLRIRGEIGWPVLVGFDLLAALLLALATMMVGVMASFALVFIPPWVAAKRADSWRKGMYWSMLLGGGAYTIAFVMALYFDQPFGAILALVLGVLGLVIA